MHLCATIDIPRKRIGNASTISTGRRHILFSSAFTVKAGNGSLTTDVGLRKYTEIIDDN